MARIGGRGCPRCGSHDTESLARRGVWACLTCGGHWTPCSTACRGWLCDIHAPEGPAIVGCAECGVPDRVARTWPEAWRDLAKHLDGRKMAATVPITDPGPGLRAVK